jgi:hypothetical protein
LAGPTSNANQAAFGCLRAKFEVVLPRADVPTEMLSLGRNNNLGNMLSAELQPLQIFL